MKPTLIVAAVLTLAVAPSAIASSCSEEITTLERRLDSSGAEKVTGKEPAGGTTSSNSPKALAQSPDTKPSDPATKPSSAGIKQAQALVQQAREEDRAGKAEACRATILKAKEAAGSLP